MKIAICGATGNVGGKLTERLLRKGEHKLTLLVRNPDRAAKFAERGARVIVVDLEDQKQVLNALRGCDAAFLVAPPKVDADDLRAFQNRVGDNFVAAIRQNRPKHVVFLSSYGAQHADGTGPIAGLHDIEEKLNAAARQTGTNIVHLRPGAFMENWFTNLDTIKSEGKVFAPVSAESRLPLVASGDVARVAEEVLLDEWSNGIQVREILGPRDYSLAESIRIISEAVGRPVNFVEVPAEDAIKRMTRRGLSRNVATSFTEMYRGLQQGLVAPQGARTIQNTLPTKFEDFARQELAPALRA